MGLSDFYVPDM